MIWTLVAIVFSGLGAAGIALMLRKLSRNKLPKWIIPVFAGAAMLAYQISYEYSWYEHQRQLQPEGALVVATESIPSAWRPWTFHIPMVTAFTILDTRNIVKNTLDADVIAEFILYRFEKQHVDVVTHEQYLLNCTRAELLPLSERKEPLLDKMKVIEKDSLLYQNVCF